MIGFRLRDEEEEEEEGEGIDIQLNKQNKYGPEGGARIAAKHLHHDGREVASRLMRQQIGAESPSGSLEDVAPFLKEDTGWWFGT